MIFVALFLKIAPVGHGNKKYLVIPIRAVQFHWTNWNSRKVMVGEWMWGKKVETKKLYEELFLWMGTRRGLEGQVRILILNMGGIRFLFKKVLDKIRDIDESFLEYLTKAITPYSFYFIFLLFWMMMMIIFLK